MAENCREKIVSEDYADFIWQSNWSVQELEQIFPDVCIQPINDFYVIFYADMEKVKSSSREEYGYNVFPALYTILQNESLEAGNILRLQNQPVLGLKGEGVLLGFIDTGIDYTNACFRDRQGRTRILEIWDQNGSGGRTPPGIDYGSVYGAADIDRALQSPDPYEIVPERDELGHGTQLASIAAGSYDEQRDWTGAAPYAKLAVVRLKPAKRYLRQYFAVPDDAVAFQENDIMLGVRYLNELALRQGMPLVICMALGSNMGGHEGSSPLSAYLNALASRLGRCIVIAAGNEANRGHHFYGVLKEGQQYEDVEVRVAENEYGLMMELWGNTADVLSVSVTSPTGETVPRVYAQNGSQRFTFLFERTVLYVDFQPLEARSGDLLIVIRMFSPMSGIWRIRVFGTSVIQGNYNIWLPVTGFVSDETVFLRSDPDITLTAPANAEMPVAVGAYQAEDISIYSNSSRGYTRKGRIKPDIAAPGVAVEAFDPGNRFTALTGTSAAAAVAAGAAALMLEWGVVKGNRPAMSNVEIRQLLIRGAKRRQDLLYPNRSWGYGTLDLFASFQELGRF